MVDPSTEWDIEARDVRKAFGGAVALDGATFGARYGEIHALLGENGAGKSTFVRILTGAIRPDAGEILIERAPLALTSVRQGIARGIDTVFQELSLMPDLTVAENLLFERQPRSQLGLVDRRALTRRAREILADLKMEGIDPGRRVRSLEISQQQIVEIAKVVSRRPKIAIFDEPTASLSREASIWLFGLLRQLTREGSAVLFISHRIREAFEIADRITVFRNGQTVSTGPATTYDEQSLVETMLGRRLAATFMQQPVPPRDETALSVSNLRLGSRFHDVTFDLRAGEILGIGGLHGQGQYDLLQALYGVHRPRGAISFFGQAVRIGSPSAALRLGVVLVPEDRRTEGLMMPLSIRENLTLPWLAAISRIGFVRDDEERTLAESIAERFSIRAPSLEHEVQTLSGGNQQKVLVGKLVGAGVRVLLLGDVTRGIDVGTREDMYALIRALAADGVAVLLYSSDSTELVALCHRVIVMFDWTIGAVLAGHQLTEENLLRAAVGLTVNGEQAA